MQEFCDLNKDLQLFGDDGIDKLFKSNNETSRIEHQRFKLTKIQTSTKYWAEQSSLGQVIRLVGVRPQSLRDP